MMFQVFTAPTAAFTRLREKPNWWLPLIITAVATVAATAVSVQYVDWSSQRETAVAQMQERGMSEEDIEAAVQRMENFTSNPLMRYGLPVVGGLITHVIAVFFLALIYNLALPLLGASGNYLRTLAVTTNAALVAVPAALVKIILMVMRRSAEVGTSLALAFPNIESRFLSVVLARVDPFTIWQVILVGLGLKVVYDIKGSKSYWLAVVVWALFTLIFGLLATLGGGR
jgi:hypothetical protein